MTSERIVLLAILTVCIYSVTIFADTGLFLLPFGIYKILLFVMSGILVITSKKWHFQEVILLVSTFVLAATSNFTLQLFFGSSDLTAAQAETITSLGILGFSFLFLTWQIAIALKEKSPFRTLQIVNACVMFACILSNQYMWLLIPTLMWCMSVFYSKSVSSVHKSFTGFFGFVVVSSWISGLYFGYTAILGNL